MGKSTFILMFRGVTSSLDNGYPGSLNQVSDELGIYHKRHYSSGLMGVSDICSAQARKILTTPTR